MIELWANNEPFVATEVPLIALVSLVVNDNRASDGDHRCGIKV